MLSRASCLLVFVASAVLLGTTNGVAIGDHDPIEIVPKNIGRTTLKEDGIDNDLTIPRLWHRLAQVQNWAQNSLWEDKQTEQTTVVPKSTTEWIPIFDMRGEMPCADGCHATYERRDDEVTFFLRALRREDNDA